MDQDKPVKPSQDLRAAFEIYFADLKADAKREGYSVNKADEWIRFVDHHKNQE